MEKDNITIGIIGGGASGMFCAGLIDSSIKVDLYEKNSILGKKLSITGNGRCNVTNDKAPAQFLENVTCGNKFLQSAIYGFSPSDMIAMLQSGQVDLIYENDNKVFPASKKSRTIVDFFKSRIKDNVTINYGTTVNAISKEGKGYVVTTDNSREYYDIVVVATGGQSYPGTGSQGDGYRLAQEMGHKVVDPRQSLCGLLTDTTLFKPCAGVASNVNVSIVDNNNKQYSKEQGSVLMTHFGVSGPAIHRLVAKYKQNSIKDKMLSIDFVPHKSANELLKEIDNFANNNAKSEIFDYVQPFFKKRLGYELLQQHNNLLSTKGASLSKEKRQQVINLLKDYKVSIHDFDLWERAIVTRGGVETININPKTMESKLHHNLFFLGEVLNVDALTGGYNLHIAFSTAYACAKHINANQPTVV